MFDAVLAQEPGRRRVGTGAMLSILFHAGVLTGALWLSARAVAPHGSRSDMPFIPFPTAPHGGSRAAGPASPAAAKPTAPKHAITKHLIPAVPQAVPVAVEETPTAAAAEPTVGTQVGPEGTAGPGDCTGPECSTGPGKGGGPPGEGEGPSGGGGLTVVPFGPGMSVPVVLSSVPIVMPAEAREAHVQGSMILNCQLDTAGAVSDCRVIKSLPFMDQAVINALMQRRYSPVTFQGQPVTIRYIFNVKITP